MNNTIVGSMRHTLSAAVIALALGTISAIVPVTAARAQAAPAAATAAAFDHDYAAFNALLAKHVRWLPGNKESRVNYAGLQADQAVLKQVLASFSAVSKPTFDSWNRSQKMAFLINAYNAFTLDLILTKYPNLKSIKDIGSVLQSPWKREFFQLLGQNRHLDWIEHEQLRPVFNDPLVHAAVNCASIGCPALRNEAFTPAKLNAQLEDGMNKFMSDNTRNRVSADGSKLEVSSIFKWFKKDFENGARGSNSLEDFMAKYATQLSSDPAVQAKIKAKSLSISHLDYDWSLNGVK